MRLFTKTSDEPLARGLLRLLVDTCDVERGDVYLLSPWLCDIVLPLGDLGHFASLFGGHRIEVPLSEVLVRVAERHRLHVICKPPDELVEFADISRLLQKIDTRARLIAEEDFRDYAISDDLVEDLNNDIGHLATRVLNHAPTLHLIQQLESAGANTYFLPRLHAKFLWTPVGALVGSANFTNGGFFRNDELMLELSDMRSHSELRIAAEDFARRGVPRLRYSLAEACRRQRIDTNILSDCYANDGLTAYVALREYLDLLRNML